MSCSRSIAAQIEAQIAQAEGIAARIRRSSTAPSATSRATPIWSPRARPPPVNLDNAKTQADIFRGAIKADQAALENLQGPAQLLHHPRADLRAASARPSSRSATSCGRPTPTPLATINQIAPVYVSFTVPQRSLPDLRDAHGRRRPPRVEAIDPGQQRARDRPGHDDREYGRSDHRHGDGARHHAEQERSAVAGHAGRRRSSPCATRTRSPFRRRRAASARPAPSCSSSRTARPRCSRSRSTRTVGRDTGDRDRA